MDGIDIDSSDVRSLRHPVPNMQDRDIGKYLKYEELDLIAGDTDDVDCENLSEEDKARYNQFRDTLIKKVSEGHPVLPVPVAPLHVPVALAPQPDEVIYMIIILFSFTVPIP